MLFLDVRRHIQTMVRVQSSQNFPQLVGPVACILHEIFTCALSTMAYLSDAPEQDPADVGRGHPLATKMELLPSS